jgi:flagellar biosynthetic protein FliR
MEPIPILVNYFFCFFRFMGVLSMVPVLSSPNYPAKAMPFLALLVSLVVFIHIPQSAYSYGFQDIEIAITCAKEFVVGLLMAVNVAAVMVILNFSGSIVSTPMGLSIAQAVDPSSGETSTTMGQFNTTIGTLLFLVMDGHHHVITAFKESFRVIPIGEVVFRAESISWFVEKYYDIFLISIKISAPLLASLIMIKFALGVLARTMPKFNIFLIGIPVSIVVGMITFQITLPFLTKVTKSMFEISFEQMLKCLPILAGSS